MKLIVAEKPSVAAEIAKVMGAGKKESGFYIGNDFIVSWCIGHLVETVMPEAYNEAYKKWNLSDLPIVPYEWKYQISQGVKKQFEIMRSLMHREDVHEIVCATDAGREGELIFRLVYQQADCHKPFLRLWISSMETKAIRGGFQTLKSGEEYDSLYDAAISRMKADWLVGINCSRLFGCISRQPLNVGRVQTPTVNLIVERQRAIDNFQSKPFYVLTARCQQDGYTFNGTKRVEEKCQRDEILEKCSGKPAVVASISKIPKKENPPPLYDLTALQREANKYLGLSAQQTLDAAQNLYEKKLITYPRTDSRYLTGDMEKTAERILNSLLNAAIINKKTVESYHIENASIKRLINDKKVTDHHALLPTMEAWKATDKLPRNEFHILLLILYRFLIASYLPHEAMKTELLLKIEGEEFKASGKEVIVQGFKEQSEQLMELLKSSSRDKEKRARNKEESEKEERLPALSEGTTIEDVTITAKEKLTQPPKWYTEDTLLSAMENAMRTLEDEELKREVVGAGLGTPATRAGIIEKVIQTGFIQRKGKNLMPTEKAYELIDLVPEKVKSPVLTAEWEQKLEQIYKGSLTGREFLLGIEGYVKELMEPYKENYTADGREIIGQCPRCGKNIYEGRTNYYCESGRDCNFVIWKEDKFFTRKRKPLTKPMVKAFLKKGRIKAAGLYSEKKNTTYTAYILMVDTGKYVNFKVHFPENYEKH